MFRFIERRENGLDAGQKLSARLRGHDGACRARQEAHAQLRLEFSDDARGLGLGQTAFAGGGREAAEAGNPRIETQGEIVLDQRIRAPAGRLSCAGDYRLSPDPEAFAGEFGTNGRLVTVTPGTGEAAKVLFLHQSYLGA